MTEFAKRLAELRKSRGETQDMLGEALGVSGKTVSKWESDATEPDLETLLKLAEHYDTTADALLGKEQSAGFEKIVLDELTADGTAAGVFRKAFEMSAKETAAMMKAIDTVAGDDSFRLLSETDGAVPDFKKGDSGVERQMIHTDMGCRYAIWHDDLNLTVGLYRNKNDFAWLMNDADRLAELFSFFADADGLKVLYTVSRADYPKEFTAAYTAKEAGIDAEKAEKLLDRLAEITSNDQGFVECAEIELTDGIRRAYRFEGNGLILSLCAVAYNILRGITINSGYNASCKLIGNKKGD